MQATAVCSGAKQLGLLLLRRLFGYYVGRGGAAKGHFEVELKFKISGDEAQQLSARLAEAGLTSLGTVSMSDTFLPAVVEGEMMRIRQQRDAGGHRRTFFTLKQWVKTRTGRTRKEAEAAVPSSLGAIFLIFGRLLSKKALLGFSKQRQLYEGTLGGRSLEVAVDEVFGLGSFSGWYLEAEVLVPLSEDPADVEQPILELVQNILNERRLPVKQSYREMLVESCRLAGAI